jgi:exodeoxyribonuclease VII large subunit
VEFHAARALVWEVAGLLQALSDTLASRYGVVAVRGELSGYSRAASGHAYFNLRAPDGSAALRCAMFRRAAGLLDFVPRDGMQVELRGRLTLYEPRGELQMVVEAMRLGGDGDLMARFLRLKAQLEAEGLFDAARKRPVSAWPRRLGIVTSLQAAVLRDVASALTRRAPHVELIVYPSLVQGAEAPTQIVRAIAQAAERAEVDTLLVCRGGGSLEDLWAFNDEAVVRAVAASPIPVISGVGHETDFTLTDFAADLRAPTPTAAAELAAAPRSSSLEQLAALEQALHQRCRARLDRSAQTLDLAALRLARPGAALQRRHEQLALLGQRWQAALGRRIAAEPARLQRLHELLDGAARHALDARRQRLDLLQARLDALGPQQVLARGYAWLADAHGQAITQAAQLRSGQTIHARLADGGLTATIDAVDPPGGAAPSTPLPAQGRLL